jgi:hypothetical protein
MCCDRLFRVAAGISATQKDGSGFSTPFYVVVDAFRIRPQVKVDIQNRPTPGLIILRAQD